MNARINYKVIFNVLYGSLMTETTAQAAIENLLNFPNTTGNDTKLVTIIFKNKDKLIRIISRAVPNYTFYRLGEVEKVVALVGAAAIISKIDPKPIVIEQCIMYAKQVCDEPAYRLLNKILDKITDIEPR